MPGLAILGVMSVIDLACDVNALLSFLHGDCLRMLSAHMDSTFEGLGAAARIARRNCVIDERLYKILVRVDVAFAVVRHISAPKCYQVRHDLRTLLGGLRENQIQSNRFRMCGLDDIDGDPFDCHNRDKPKQERREGEKTKEDEAEAKTEQEVAKEVEQEAETKTKHEVEAETKQEAANKAKQEAETKAKREAEEKTKQEAANKAKPVAKAKAKQEAEAKTEQEAANRARREAESKAKQEAEARAKQEAELQAMTNVEKANATNGGDYIKKRTRRKFIAIRTALVKFATPRAAFGVEKASVDGAIDDNDPGFLR